MAGQGLEANANVEIPTYSVTTQNAAVSENGSMNGQGLYLNASAHMSVRLLDKNHAPSGHKKLFRSLVVPSRAISIKRSEYIRLAYHSRRQQDFENERRMFL